MRARVAGGVALAALAMVTVTGCTSSADEASPSVGAASTASPVLDCTLAQASMDDYSVALSDLATSIEAGDAMSAVAAADAMSYSLDQLESALPGIPEAGQGFLAASRAVAIQVKQSAAESPQMTGLLGELTSAFSDPAFADGGDAIDEYADQVCPSMSPAPSAS